MKFSKLHLFLILLGSLILSSSLGAFVRREGMHTKDTKGPYPPPAAIVGTNTGTNTGTNAPTDGPYPSETLPSNYSRFLSDIGVDENDNNQMSSNSGYIGPAGDKVIVSHKKKHKNGPLGIPASQIPAGSEDMYILKSEVIPPVCPACPTVSGCPRPAPYPACPPCGRCPEPAFECKKVPNYSSNTDNNSYIPVPVLADFSQFGM